VPDRLPMHQTVYSASAPNSEATRSPHSKLAPEFYFLSGDGTESAGAHDQGSEDDKGLDSGQTETPQESQAGKAPEHIAASIEGSTFWSSAVTLSQKAGSLVGTVRNVVAEETHRCVNDARGVIQDTRMIGETLSATVSASGAAVANQPQVQTALETIKQGLVVTADVSWDILRDVDQGQRELIGAFRQGMRESHSERTEPATDCGDTSVDTATDTEWTIGARHGPTVQAVGCQVSDQAKDATSSFVDNHVEAGEAWKESTQHGVFFATSSGSKKPTATTSGKCKEDSIFIIGSDDEDAEDTFFDNNPALEHWVGEATEKSAPRT